MVYADHISVVKPQASFYCVLPLCLLLLLTPVARAQSPFSDDYYLSETSRPLRVTTLLQDARSFMWLGTDTGLFRFNGQGDLMPVHDALRDSVTALSLIRGVIYVGYAGGTLGRVAGDSIVPVPLRGATPRSRIRSIDGSLAGIILLCTSEGLFAVTERRSVRIDASRGLSANDCYCTARAPDGGLLVGTGLGLDKINLRGGRLVIRHYTAADGLPGGSVRVLKRLPGTAFVWLGAENGIARLEWQPAKSSWKLLRSRGGWRWGRISDLLPMAAGGAWAAMERDYVLEITVADSLRITPHIYEGKEYTRMLRSGSGNLWLGTATGLSSLSADFARYLPLPPPYALTRIVSMACDRQNTIWYAAGRQLFALPPVRPARPLLKAGLPAGITCLHADAAGGLWIGTAGQGLWYRNAAGVLKKQQGSEAWAGSEIYSIASSPARLWLGGGAGLAELDVSGAQRKLLQRNERFGENADGPVYGLLAARNGAIWMATGAAGVCMYDGFRFHQWDSAGGLPARSFYTLTEDAAGAIWAGSGGEGLFRFDGKRWQRYGRENGLQDLSIATVAANATGQVVVVNAEGIDQWYPDNRQFRRYNPRTGPSIDTVSAEINCAARDTAGNVYVPVDGGLCLFNNIGQPLELRPSVHISRLTVFQQPVRPGTALFAHDQNHISFHYEGVNFVNIEALHYRYRLDGYGDEWTESTQGVVSFPRLAPGKYKLRLQASLDKDFEEATEIVYPFEVLPPFWRRAWFILLAGCSLVLITYFYVRRRERAIRALAQLRQERVQFEYELLKNQVDPHFLFNSLNILTNLIEESQDDAIKYTVQLSALYRNILSYRNKETILLSEECSLLSAYIHIQKRRFGDALHTEVDIPKQVLQSSSIVPLALQFLVENAIKHNRVSLSEPLTIRIFISEEQELVVLNPLRPKIGKTGGEGLGLQNIRTRYALLSRRPVSYGTEGDDFVVKLPLL